MVSQKGNCLGDYLDRLTARALGRIPRAQPAIGDHSSGGYPSPIIEDWEQEPLTAPPGQEDQSQRDPAAEQLSTSPTGAVEPGPVGTAAQKPGGRNAEAAGVTDELLPRIAPAPTGKGQPGSYAAGSQADLTKAAPATLPRQATTPQGEPSMASSGDQSEPQQQGPETGLAENTLSAQRLPAAGIPFTADSGDQPERREQGLETGPTEATTPTLQRQAEVATGQPAASTDGDQPGGREQGLEKVVAKPTLAAIHPQVTPIHAEPTAVTSGAGPGPVVSAFEVGPELDAEPAAMATGLVPLKVSSDIGIGGDIPLGPLQEPEFSPATGPARRPPGAQSSNEPYSAVPTAQSAAKGSRLAEESALGKPVSPGFDLPGMNRGSPMETSFTWETARPTSQLGGPKSQASGVDDELVWSPPQSAGGGEPAIPAGGQHAPAEAESPGLRPMPQPPRPASPPADFSRGTTTTRPLPEAGEKTGEPRDFPPVIDQALLPSKPLTAADPRTRALVNAAAPRLRSEDPTAGPPPIQVTIDRIEIQGPPALEPAPTPSPPVQSGPALTLDEYLRQRDEEA